MKNRNKLAIVITIIVWGIAICYRIGAETVATFPYTYSESNAKCPIGLHDLQKFDNLFEYNPTTNSYELYSKITGADFTTFLSLTQEEYLNYTLHQDMYNYFKTRNNNKDATNREKEDVLSIPGINFELEPMEKIFGTGGIRLQPHGSITFKVGMTYNFSSKYPILADRQRNHWSFDFDPQIQASVISLIGDKINFDLDYNTQSMFSFDTKKLKLVYTGKEDEIVKTIEAGNVSMNTTNSLIRGGAALFGIKTELQFGKLTMGTVVSQQNSQCKTISSKGNVQTTPFEITVDNYDVNTHFFLSHHFVDIYDKVMEKLPFIQSDIVIDNIEVWVTNKRSDNDHARNIIAFADLGEYDYKRIGNPNFVCLTAFANKNIPQNCANNLYDNLINNYPEARNMIQLTQVLDELVCGCDYEKIENARKLEPAEYELNSQLGYISLRTPLQSDEVVAVAFSYTYQGKSYQVGEFSTDKPDNFNENLYLKMLKGTFQSPISVMWRLMMKNVYTISNCSIEKDKFCLDIKYMDDTSGVYLNYLTEGAIANQLLLRVVNLDRLNVHNELYPDGFFDYVEGYTVLSQRGKIIFPVVQPFGEHLRKMIADARIADKYVYQELYDSTLTVARQLVEKNKFILTGEYKNSNSLNIINLDGFNFLKNSVVVRANGFRLNENVDYVVNNGQISITNPVYENADVQIFYENQSAGMRQKNIMSLNFDYAFSPKFNIGATIMNIKEIPMDIKTALGEESINSIIFGFNTNYSNQSQWLTSILNKLPFVKLTNFLQIVFNTEYARSIPKYYWNKCSSDYSYIDNFEKAKTTINICDPNTWFLSATPSLFPESKLVNDIRYGNNRALLAWYYIDKLFTRKHLSTPIHIKNDNDQLSNHYIREIQEEDFFSNKNTYYNEFSTIPVFNLAFYPKERGPYNLDITGMNSDGELASPQSRWGGIFRKIESDQVDFESHNVGYIEFWLLDPFIYNKNSSGGDLYFNLGEVSEDILKDGRKFFENGIPVNGDTTRIDKTVWGYVPKQQPLKYTFDLEGSQKVQDTGLNGLMTQQEFNYPTYADYLKKLKNWLSTETVERMKQDQFSPFNDPAGDNYHYFGGIDYDLEEMSILKRYKHYNGTEGNSTLENSSIESKISPDVEDINRDNTLNENESYFQYKISIRPSDMKVGKNFIVNKKIATPKLKNGKVEEVVWYLFRIPICDYEKIEGGIRGFQSIRFIRMFLTGFADSIILRFATLELVCDDWKIYSKNLTNPNLALSNTDTQISIATVGIEESSNKQPVNYIMPPGRNKITDFGQSQLISQSEKSLSAKITHLSPGDARCIYKNKSLDIRQYRRFQMFVHAEEMLDFIQKTEDNDLSIFLRLGSGYANNYYEYEIPLKITPPAPIYGYSNDRDVDKEIVWPSSNKFDFPFEVLINLKLNRDEERKMMKSRINLHTPYFSLDPMKPMNKIAVCGNPDLSNIKVIMIGIRNNSHSKKSVEIWIDEMCLTEFNRDGGWAGNVGLYMTLPDLGSFSFVSRKETSDFDVFDQRTVDRNLNNKQSFNISTQVDMGNFFPKKTKVSIPFYFLCSKYLVYPKYSHLNNDVLLRDVLDNIRTKEEQDVIKKFTLDKIINRTLSFNDVHTNISSKIPMPYDLANFTFGYSYLENLVQNATTEYDWKTNQRLYISYFYSPMVKSWKPFYKKGKSIIKSQFISNLELMYLPKSILLNSDIECNCYKLKLHGLENPKASAFPFSSREDSYWNWNSTIDWELTRNLQFNLNMKTNACIDSFPYLQINKQLSRLEVTMDYNQQFSAIYQFPFHDIVMLDFVSGNLSYNAQYIWQRAVPLDTMNIGHTITCLRTVGLNNFIFNLFNLYRKNKFLENVNKKYMLYNSSSTNCTKEDILNKKLANRKKKEKFECKIHINTDSLIIVRHLLNNKRLKVVAHTTSGRLYNIDYEILDDNSIQVKNRDTVCIELTISQLPPLEDLLWYKIAQKSACGLMSLRFVSFSYNRTQKIIIPGFRPEIKNLFGQSNTAYGNAPGLDFAFGLVGKNYLDKINANKWLLANNMYNVNLAVLNNMETFDLNAVLEPFVGMKINLTANRYLNNQEYHFMNESMPKRFSGNFNMTTIAFYSAFKGSDSDKGFKSFKNFLLDCDVISNHDVLIPAFLAAYAGKNPKKIGLNFFPSLVHFLPNWKVTYSNFVQVPIIKKYFRYFTLEHEYKCHFSIGVNMPNNNLKTSDNGLGYVYNISNNQLIPFSPEIAVASITEIFDPLIKLNSILFNNINLKMECKISRDINLNISSCQIVELITSSAIVGIDYRIKNFNRIIKFFKESNYDFNNDLCLSFDFFYKKNRSLSQNIFTYSDTKNTQMAIKGTVDYNFSHLLALQAFFDKQINNPLILITAFHYPKFAFGINIKINLNP